MAFQIVYEPHQPFLDFVSTVNDRGVRYGAEARAVSIVDTATRELLACTVFSQWNTLGHAEASIASNGGRTWCNRTYINAVYRTAFEVFGLRRMNMVADERNTAAVQMHEMLGHVREGELQHWFEDGHKAILYRYAKQDYEKSRWFKWREKQEGREGYDIQSLEGRTL